MAVNTPPPPKQTLVIILLSLTRLTIQQNIYQKWPCSLVGCSCQLSPCCPTNGCGCGGSCPFNSACECNLPSTTCSTYSYYCGKTTCAGSTPNVFPLFTFYNAAPVTSMCFVGNYSTIYDNALYLITTLTEAQIAIQQQDQIAMDLVTYENTFLTMNENGVTGLMFLYFKPLNLSIISNKKYITSLTIQYTTLANIPDSASNTFPSIANLTLSYNAIKTVQPNDINSGTLTYLDLSNNHVNTIDPAGLNASLLQVLILSNNQLSSVNSNNFNLLPSLQNVTFDHNLITTVESDAFRLTLLKNVTLTNNLISTLQPAAFNVSSLNNIYLSNNMLTNLLSNAFNLNALVTLDVSNNQITTFDSSSAFTGWLQASQKNMLNLTNNPLPCDSTIQWMATFSICPPTQIIITQSETCPNGEPILDYLIPYAKCN